MATANTWKSAAKVSKLGINPPRMAIYRKFTIFIQSGRLSLILAESRRFSESGLY